MFSVFSVFTKNFKDQNQFSFNQIIGYFDHQYLWKQSINASVFFTERLSPRKVILWDWKSNSLLLVGLGQASAAKLKLASGLFDHLSSDWQIDKFMWKQESFFSLFDTKELRLGIKMLLFNWMADFFDHQ